MNDAHWFFILYFFIFLHDDPSNWCQADSIPLCEVMFFRVIPHYRYREKEDIERGRKAGAPVPCNRKWVTHPWNSRESRDTSRHGFLKATWKRTLVLKILGLGSRLVWRHVRLGGRTSAILQKDLDSISLNPSRREEKRTEFTSHYGERINFINLSDTFWISK